MKKEKPFICIITGPPGVGKSTVSKKLAGQFQNSALIDVDYLREMVKNGYTHPFPKTKESTKQVELGMENACALAKNFVAKGFNSFIDDIVDSEKQLDYYLKKLNKHKTFVFCLMTDKATLKKRDNSRRKELVMGARAMQLHCEFSKRKGEKKWHCIDTTKQNPKETAEEIARIIGKNK